MNKGKERARLHYPGQLHPFPLVNARLPSPSVPSARGLKAARPFEHPWWPGDSPRARSRLQAEMGG